MIKNMVDTTTTICERCLMDYDQTALVLDMLEKKPNTLYRERVFLVSVLYNLCAWTFN